jgi:hypothetical protein
MKHCQLKKSLDPSVQLSDESRMQQIAEAETRLLCSRYEIILTCLIFLRTFETVLNSEIGLYYHLTTHWKDPEVYILENTFPSRGLYI